MALTQDLLECRAAFCISHQPLQIRPAHPLKAEMASTSRELEPAARFPEAHCSALVHWCSIAIAGLICWAQLVVRPAKGQPASSKASGRSLEGSYLCLEGLQVI
jgi:hypothetical protein